MRMPLELLTYIFYLIPVQQDDFKFLCSIELMVDVPDLNKISLKMSQKVGANMLIYSNSLDVVTVLI